MKNKITPKYLALFVPVLLLIIATTVSEAADYLPQVRDKLEAASENQPLILTDSQQGYPLGLYLDILKDPSGELTIDDVTSPAYAAQFMRNEKTVPNFGFTDAAYWVRFSLDNQATQTNEWLLEDGFANTQYLDFYMPRADGQGFVVKQTGVLRPISSRDVIFPNLVFGIDLSPQSTQTFYLRISSGTSITIPLTLWTRNAFIMNAGQTMIRHWLVFGALMALLGYHLFLLISLKDAVYLYYVMMTTSMLAVLLEYTGYMGVYILPNLFYLKPYYFPVFIIALFVSILLFSDAFLQLKTLHPRLHQLSYIFMALWLAALLLIPFTDFLTLSRLLVPAELITIGVTFIIGIYTWRKGFRPMGFFLLAWLGMAASVFLLLLVRLTVIPSTYITENLFQFGFVFMAVSWSIALADRINLLKIQTDQAYHDLRMSESKLNQILEGLPLGVVVYGKDQKPSYINKRTAEILSDTDKGTQPDPGAGRTLAQGIDHFSFQLTGTGQIYPLEDFPVQRALNGDPVFADNIEVKDGNRRVPLEMWASPVRDDMGNVESAIAAFQDITMRKQAEVELDHYRKNLEQLVKERTAQLSSINEQLDHEMEERKNLERTMVQRIEWLSTLNEIRQNLIGIDSLNEAYEQCSDAILPLLDAQTLFILRWDEQDFQFKMQWRSRTGTAHPKQEAFQKIFKKGSPLRKQLDKGKVILYSAEQAATLPMPFIKCFQMEDFNSLILSPMLIGQVVHGVLGITRAESIDELVSYQVGIVESIAYNLAHLIDDAVMLDQRRTLATIEERNRLARELHDSVAQTLYSISLFTDATRLALESNRPEIVRQHLDDLSELSQEAMSDMRMLIFELRPPILEQEGLAAALQSRLDAVESRAGVKAIFNTKGELHLTLEQESELFRIAQEALNNVVKHAHARQVRVDLIGQAQGIRMTIKDDGIGFHPEEAEQSGGQGFRNIRERAEILDAKYSINSNIGRGTKIVVEVNK